MSSIKKVNEIQRKNSSGCGGTSLNWLSRQVHRASTTGAGFDSLPRRRDKLHTPKERISKRFSEGLSLKKIKRLSGTGKNR